METITIAEVLSEIRSATDQTRPFVLVYVKSRGGPRSQGQIRTIAKAIKGPRQKDHPDIPEAGSGSTRGKYLYKEHDTLPLIDIEAGNKLRTIPISHIIGYNHFKVTH